MTWLEKDVAGFEIRNTASEVIVQIQDWSSGNNNS
jgi:hypothetical protein